MTCLDCNLEEEGFEYVNWLPYVIQSSGLLVIPLTIKSNSAFLFHIQKVFIKHLIHQVVPIFNMTIFDFHFRHSSVRYDLYMLYKVGTEVCTNEIDLSNNTANINSGMFSHFLDITTKYL